MKIEVTRCEECPLFSRDIDDSEYCSQGGKPESRYPEGDPWEEKLEKKKLPNNCPLKTENVTVALVVQTTKE